MWKQIVVARTWLEEGGPISLVLFQPQAQPRDLRLQAQVVLLELALEQGFLLRLLSLHVFVVIHMAAHAWF